MDEQEQKRIKVRAQNRASYKRRTINGINSQLIPKELQKKKGRLSIFDKKALLLYDEYLNNKNVDV